jgi:hypothetical protein
LKRLMSAILEEIFNKTLNYGKTHKMIKKTRIIRIRNQEKSIKKRA